MMTMMMTTTTMMMMMMMKCESMPLLRAVLHTESNQRQRPKHPARSLSPSQSRRPFIGRELLRCMFIGVAAKAKA